MFEMLSKYQEILQKERKEKEEILEGKLWLEEHYNNAIKEIDNLKNAKQTDNNEGNKYIHKIINKIKSKRT